MVTNGFNLDRHPILPYVLSATKTTVCLSVHSREEKYTVRITKAFEILQQWKDVHGINVGAWDSVSRWRRFYKGVGKYMLPFADNDIASSWKACRGNEPFSCINLVNNRLFKCPEIANLQFVVDRFHLADNPAWEPYLSYKGIGLDCDDDTLSRFVTAAAEPVCGMCPAKPDYYEKDIYNIDFDLPTTPYVARQ
jgi:hypothetical protein